MCLTTGPIFSSAFALSTNLLGVGVSGHQRAVWDQSRTTPPGVSTLSNQCQKLGSCAVTLIKETPHFSPLHFSSLRLIAISWIRVPAPSPWV